MFIEFTLKIGAKGLFDMCLLHKTPTVSMFPQNINIDAKDYLIGACYTQTPIESIFPLIVYGINTLTLGVKNYLIGACYTKTPIEEKKKNHLKDYA